MNINLDFSHLTFTRRPHVLVVPESMYAYAKWFLSSRPPLSWREEEKRHRMQKALALFKKKFKSK